VLIRAEMSIFRALVYDVLLIPKGLFSSFFQEKILGRQNRRLRADPLQCAADSKALNSEFFSLFHVFAAAIVLPAPVVFRLADPCLNVDPDGWGR
jgi:hypothetical protein